ncbi:hypothetical protein FCV62_05950 [Vibrio kanaloae]|uniref:hypothetical protein n=1 Tax=Vibrio kanaloae TaxID=170673 RepID=UPI0010BEC441|nr:hypothetical protein [Vibrio kanaloae]QPK05329.1 hypothetical protein BTD91_05210 [Vibrio kanaloae]TKF80579.1 hypothetical protein FCV62_05950 [Vibrio kanaloae]
MSKNTTNFRLPCEGVYFTTHRLNLSLLKHWINTHLLDNNTDGLEQQHCHQKNTVIQNTVIQVVVLSV